MAVMRTALYSQPPSLTHGPLGAWTLRMAVTIVEATAVAASGVAAPRARSAPPPASAAPAAMAFRFPGRSPRFSKNWPVPSGPWPPNQPKSFCVPWPTNRPPTTPRRASLAMSMPSRVPGDARRRTLMPDSAPVGRRVIITIAAAFLAVIAASIATKAGDDDKVKSYGTFTECSSFGTPVVTDDPRGDQRTTKGDKVESSPQGDLVRLRLAKSPKGDRL